ncbi:MAG TPA: ankyrin repeat domain-containing protein [Bryobacteraceae bacterium]|jgi:ankyrin repeat protein
MSGVEDVIAAAQSGEMERLASLLDANPSLATASNMLGVQAIHAAHFGGHASAVDLLLSRGVVLDAFLAAELGMLNRVRQAVAADPQVVHALSPVGSALLHRACYWGQTEVARYLLDQGADADAATCDGFLQIRPLGCAVATPNIPNPSDREEVVLELVGMLLARGAGVNGRRRDGLTALHSAAYRGHLRVITVLLDRGADPALRGYEGMGAHASQTAADVAASQGQEEAYSLLRGVAA